MTQQPNIRAAETGEIQISEIDGVRFLQLEDGAVQSAMRLDAPAQLELEYTRAMMGFLLFHRHPRDICLIGLGGGSLARFIHRHLPESRITAVEIVPEVVTAARDWFGLPPDDARLQVVTGDGAAFVRSFPVSRDVLLVDGYDAFRIAADLTTPDFYRSCRSMLKPGGIAVFNLWGSDPGFPGFLNDLKRAFDQHVVQLPAATKANVIVIGFRPPLPDTSFAYLSGRADRLQSDLKLEFDDFLVRMGYCNPCSDSGFLV
jgi:spermidine synthase